MKKRTILLLILIIFPVIVCAETNDPFCHVISGTGNDIGDEIECAGEHFYIVSRTKNKTRMLTKYNLYSGEIFIRIPLSQERFDELRSQYGGNLYYYVTNPERILVEPEFAKYKDFIDSIDSNRLYIPYLPDSHTFIIELSINDYRVSDDAPLVHQDPSAIGAHGDAIGNPDPIEIGIFHNHPARCSDAGSNANIYNSYYCDVDSFPSYFTLDVYEEYLNAKNIVVDGMDFLSVGEIVDIVKQVSGKNIPLKEWFEEQQTITIEDGLAEPVNVLGDLKEYLPEKYSWLYSTTYWTKTGFSQSGIDYYHDNLYNYGFNPDYATFFVDTLGFICNQEGCSDAVGAGERPVVTIDNSILKYAIYKVSHGSGSIDVVSSAAPGELINFTIRANKDLELKSLAIITPSGERIEFTENEITYNNDGTITIRSNSFIMPNESVTIEAEWADYVKGVEDNPKTGISDYFMGIYILVTISIITYFLVRKREYFKGL